MDQETQHGNITNRPDEQDNYVFINNRTPQTDYYCYVQALCENDVYGYWSEPFKFTTLCSGQPLPYYTNFNEVSINELPDCWSHNVEITGSFLEPQFVPYVTKNISQGTDSMSLFMRAVSGSNGLNTMAIFPQFSHDFPNVTLLFMTLPSTYSTKVGFSP